MSAVLQPGTRVGAFQIVESLGAGGMGRVYVARDPRLGRTVALKVIRDDLADRGEAIARFRNEARAASALNHPAIIHIYEIEETVPILPDGMPSSFGALLYIAMEHVRGRTLRDHMRAGTTSPQDLLEWGAQLCDGMARAHDAGLLHRDLKPENVMISDDGFVKILDFGAAKLNEEASDETPTTPATADGTAYGTVPYMAPEQLRGRKASEASDVFGIGCMLIEAIAGVHPFERESTPEVIHAIVYEEPDVSLAKTRLNRGLFELLSRCLSKDPAKRPTARELCRQLRALQQNPGALKVDSSRPSSPRNRFLNIAIALGATILVIASILLLRSRSSTATASLASEVHQVASIAILPFANQSGDPETEYLADGITEHLIYDLSRSRGLRVVPRTSVFRLRSDQLSPRDAGRKLGVDAVVGGELLADEDNLVVRVELIDVRSGALLWGSRFDRRADAIVDIQQQIARGIRAALQQEEITGSGSTRDPEAFRLYLRGRYFWNKRTADGLQQAAQQFRAALDRDPSFAQAWVGLGDSYALLEQYAGAPSKETCPRAKSAILRALELDPQLAQAHASLGLLYGHCEWNWEASEGAFRRAIELDPNYVTTHHWYALHLAYRRRFDEALSEARRAQELDPLSLIANNSSSVVYGYAGDWRQVLQQSDRLIEMDGGFAVARMWKGRALRALGDHDGAIAELRRAVELSGRRSPEVLGELAATLAIAGQRDEAAKLIAELRSGGYSAAYPIAGALAALGDHDGALAEVRRAMENHSWFLVQLDVEPLFTPLRDDPRFLATLQQVNLPPGQDARATKRD